LDIIIPLVTFSLIGWAVVILMGRWIPATDRQWMLGLLALALGLRLLSATLFGTFSGLRIFHEDAHGYESIGLALASGWMGDGPPYVTNLRDPGFIYLIGALNYVFGRYRVVASYFNCLLGTFIVFLVYQLTTRFFHSMVARRAALLVALMPSMILWSSVALKDVMVTACIIISLSSCVSLKERVTIQAFLGTVLPLVLIQLTRFYITYFVAFSVVLALVLDRGIGMLTGIYKQAFIVAAAVGLFALLGLSDRTGQDAEYFNLETASSYRRGMATTARSGFAQDADVSTPTKAAAFLPIGMANMLFAPFPWQMTSLRALIAAPETILWWCLFPATLRGLIFAIRRRFAQVSPLVIFAATLTPAYSLIHGNVGSAFRQRAQILVFLFIFSAVGMYRTKCKKAGLDPDLLLKDRPADLGTGASAASPA
jgi:4-amino-4-deoxy-L-arabinose transferase-like glycosyltransferase